MSTPAQCTHAEKVRGESVKATIEDAAMNTGAHGIANIYRTDSLPRKIFWIIMFTGGMGEHDKFPDYQHQPLSNVVNLKCSEMF